MGNEEISLSGTRVDAMHSDVLLIVVDVGLAVILFAHLVVRDSTRTHESEELMCVNAEEIGALGHGQDAGLAGFHGDCLS